MDCGANRNSTCSKLWKDSNACCSGQSERDWLHWQWNMEYSCPFNQDQCHPTPSLPLGHLQIHPTSHSLDSICKTDNERRLLCVHCFHHAISTNIAITSKVEEKSRVPSQMTSSETVEKRIDQSDVWTWSWKFKKIVIIGTKLTLLIES